MPEGRVEHLTIPACIGCGAMRQDENCPVACAVVWRCPDCGGLDAPQPCIGVCIWRPGQWQRSWHALQSQARHALKP